MNNVFSKSSRNWSEVCLDDFIKVKHGYAFKGKYITIDKTSQILVTPGNFNIGGGFKSAKFKYYTADYPDAYTLKENDIVVTMTDLSKESDTLGYSAKVPKSIDGEKYLHNQRVGLVQFKDENVDTDFIYWVMRTREYQWFIVGSASGTSIMHTSPDRICEYEFLLPLLTEQKAIASVLSSLDNKIDLLYRQNKTLEGIAETLFRHWFDELDFESTINDLISIQNGYAFKSKDFSEFGENRVLKIKNITNSNVNISTSDFVSNKIAENVNEKFGVLSGDILFAMTGAEIGKMGLVERNYNKLWLNQRVGLFKEKYKGSKYLAYLCLKSDFGQDYIENTATGSAQPNISSTGIEACPFPKLNLEEIKYYSEILSPLYDKVIFNLAEIKTLKRLRDTILPKLMSGEIRLVQNVNKSII